jgi:hypothetical protein
MLNEAFFFSVSSFPSLLTLRALRVLYGTRQSIFIVSFFPVIALSHWSVIICFAQRFSLRRESGSG